ncbi:MAG: hypothetical protein RL391_206 [Actinomycetota bacterium]
MNRPATLISQEIQSHGTAIGTRRTFRDLGAPLDALDFQFVNGLVYSRVRPLIRPDHPAKSLPPLPALKILIRIHPEMRRRARRSNTTLSNRPWRKVSEDWSRPGGTRQQCEERNLALQEIDLQGLSDEELIAHARRVFDHSREMWELHFWLHGFDVCPIGFLISSAPEWGLTPADVIPLLEGASPSTTEAERVLHRIREAVEASGRTVGSLDDIRAVSPSVAADVDHFLRLRGSLVFSRYDIDGLCLREAPEVLFSTIMASRDDAARRGEVEKRLTARIAAVRARVPAESQAEFDQLLTEARVSMDLRDDNGPHTLEWPLGLIRLAMLEIGRRLTANSHIARAEHALELAIDEVDVALFAGGGPGAQVLADRQRWRETVDVSGAPRTLGDPEPIPPLEALPSGMAKLVLSVQSVLSEAGMDGAERTSGLSGTGVGSGVYRGRACRADNPEDAVTDLEPGDVLVVPCTTPAYNMVLPLAGAIVTAEGGALSHAAVLARELGIPAVVGALDALTRIPDGAIVEVDADRGEVRIVSDN